MTDRHAFVERLLSFDAPQPHEALGRFQASARQKLEAATVPGRKSEEWRFYDLRPIVDLEWSLADAQNSVDTTEFVLPEASTTSMVVRNGTIDQSGSNLVLPDGVAAGSFADISEEARGLILDAIGSATTNYTDELFNAANGALLRDVVCIVVPPETVVEQPIQVCFVGDGDDVVQATRLVVVAGKGSKFTIVEDYRGGEGRYFTNAVTEVVVGESANVHHVRVQRENFDVRHVARIGARVGTFARYDSVHVALGAHSSRHDVWVSHEGEDGWSRLDGLAMVDGERESDTHTVVDNTRMRCESHQLHKCIVDGRGHAVFNGKIFVRHGAQKIDAYQLNRNLLLSSRAKVDTKPQLEIFADDVQCTHGATVGQLDPEQLFYLTSRGISENEALSILTYAFAAEVIDSIGVPSLARDLEEEANVRTMGATR